jgi:hypothetical protein
MPEGDLFERGLEVRREVLGAEYVDASMASADWTSTRGSPERTISGHGSAAQAHLIDGGPVNIAANFLG